MVYKYFLFFVLFCVSSFSSLRQGVDAFHEGNYKEARRILGQDNFDENINAQFFLLASQGFGVRDRDEHLVAGLKSLVQKALNDSRHDLHIPAQLIHIFWNLYSENTQQDSPLRTGGIILTAPMEIETPVARRAPSRGVTEDDALLEEGIPQHRPDISIPMDLPPLGSSFERPDLDEIESHIHRGQYFPIPTLFEGEPSERVGVTTLSDLVRGRNSHALFCMGSYFLAQDQEGHKSTGLGCLVSAAHLDNTAAHNLVKNLIGIKEKKGWTENCTLWFCSGGPACAERLVCGGDARGEWWRCNFGLFGFKTRWSLGQLCSNVRNVSRTSLENLAMLAGMGLLLVQQLETAGLIDIFEDNQAVVGWIGLLAAGGGFGAARVNA
jgi:hypothetical protein